MFVDSFIFYVVAIVIWQSRHSRPSLSHAVQTILFLEVIVQSTTFIVHQIYPQKRLFRVTAREEKEAKPLFPLPGFPQSTTVFVLYAAQLVCVSLDLVSVQVSIMIATCGV